MYPVFISGKSVLQVNNGVPPNVKPFPLIKDDVSTTFVQPSVLNAIRKGSGNECREFKDLQKGTLVIVPCSELKSIIQISFGGGRKGTTRHSISLFQVRKWTKFMRIKKKSDITLYNSLLAAQSFHFFQKRALMRKTCIRSDRNYICYSEGIKNQLSWHVGMI